MEESDVSYSLENEQQFWEELEDIVSTECGQDNSLIDNTLRSFLHLTSTFRDEYLLSEYDIAHCSSRLLNSQLFIQNTDYVNLQLVYSLLQEEEPALLYIIASLLLFGGRQDERIFEVMNDEGCFVYLLGLLMTHRGASGLGEDGRVHRLILELLYEMSRVQRLSLTDLSEVDDAFIMHLFQIIETLSDDIHDPYHYPVIRVLLVLNEQYMVASTAQPSPGGTRQLPPTNRVIKVLSKHGSNYMTFSENLILLLNRETETSLQLLILKLLYLLFTTPQTHEYFYTNDLRVLLDVIIRNLLDLPNDEVSLRHIYLRVLCPLLAYTQLSHPPYYKREEIIRTLSILGGGGGHFESADDTTLRLVERVAQVPWLRESEEGGIKDNEVAKKLLGISLSPTQSSSNVSVVDVAAVTAEPGVQTPSRSETMPRLQHTDSMTSDIESPLDTSGGVEITFGDGTQLEIEKAREEIIQGVQLSDPMERQRRVPPTPPMPRLSQKKSMLGITGEKKLPPKTPPRRRTKMKQSLFQD